MCSIFKNRVTPGWLSFDARTRTPFSGRLALQTLLHRPASWRTFWQYKVPMQNRLGVRATDAPRIDLIKAYACLPAAGFDLLVEILLDGD
jgi:hypothetical protein